MPCMEAATNANTFPSVGLFRPFAQGCSAPKQWNNLQNVEAQTNTKLVIRPEDFIWLELSMVPEVERVFVERRGDAFQIMTVVNDRSVELRKRIFARERAIIDELRQYEFDFDIFTRLNHKLEDLVTISDKPSYAR
jgi:hypothetical protein